MKVVGKIQSLWRYPVKSMRGEELQEAFVGFPGVYGDRLYAFRSSSAPKGFPYLTGREQEVMLLYRPRFRHPERAIKPGNLAEAEALAPGVTPVYAESSDFAVDVETPAGERLSIDDPRLIDKLREGIRDRHELTLLRSDRAMTDCRPVSIFSIQTARARNWEWIWISGASAQMLMSNSTPEMLSGKTSSLAEHCGWAQRQLLLWLIATPVAR